MSESRSRMISLRLSEGEYEALKSQYRSCGARSISEFARLALQRVVLEPAAAENDVAAKLAELDSRVHILEANNELLAKHAHLPGEPGHVAASEINNDSGGSTLNGGIKAPTTTWTGLAEGLYLGAAEI